MRRTLIILAILIVLVGIGAAAYFYFSATDAGVVAVAPGTGTTLPNSGATPVTPDQNGTIPTTTQPAGTPVKVSARLVQIDTGPVVPGESVRDTLLPNSTTTPDVVVTYLARQSGNVFTYSLGTGTLTRTSNKTIPGIQSAAWLPDASTAFVRYLSGADSTTVNTYALPANGSAGFFLSQNLADISVSSSTILTLASGANGSIGSVTRADGTHPAQAFTTSLSAIRTMLAGSSKELVFTKASATLAGDAYLVSGGKFTRIAGPLNGLVALTSPSGKWALVSYSTNGALGLELVNTATGAATTLPIATIADKCVWTANESAIYCGVPQSPSASYSYPDDWYQGAVHFSDRIWKIDVSGRFAQLVLDFPKETSSTLDATNLALPPSGSALIFLNKNDGSLWSYKL